MTDDKHRGTIKAWPTKDAMAQVYREHLWGGHAADFYSGEGSHAPEIVDPYVEAMRAFLATLHQTVVCDLGCGDFNVGSQLLDLAEQYIAVDIVPDLIDRNKKRFQADNLAFQCLDLANEDLPPGDCAILRQVLQHVSNTEIQAIVEKLKAYKYIILTEHIPSGGFAPNKDILSGQGIRLKKGSGVDLLAPPFNFSVKESRRLLTIVPADGMGIIVTDLLVV